MKEHPGQKARRFTGWNIGISSRRQSDGESISPKEGAILDIPRTIIPAAEQQSAYLPPKLLPPQTQTESRESCPVEPRDSAGPLPLSATLADLAIHDASEGKDKCKGKEIVSDAKSDLDLRSRIREQPISWVEQSGREVKQLKASIRANKKPNSRLGPGSWNRGTSVSETFAYYADKPCRKGFWSSILSQRSRSLRPKPPKFEKATTHAKAALCEKVVRNGGARTNEECAMSRPFRVANNIVRRTSHAQQMCLNPHHHFRVKRCNKPVKSCHHCDAVASSSQPRNTFGSEGRTETANDAGSQACQRKKTGRVRRGLNGLQSIFS